MILLLGGTTETIPIATGLADAGHTVLVSAAAALPDGLPQHERIQTRQGGLSEYGMRRVIEQNAITTVVDATHPYAAEVTTTAQNVCQDAGVSFVCYLRPPAVSDEDCVVRVQDHRQAAASVCEIGQNILLTIGTRNIDTYAAAARTSGRALFVRVLPNDTSVNACKQAGIPDTAILRAKGPSSTEDNSALIRKYRIDVIVTKDSGQEGGTTAKLEAARREECALIMVDRPQCYPSDACRSVEEVLNRVGV